MRTLLLISIALLHGCALQQMTPAQRHAFGQAMYEAGQQMLREDDGYLPAPPPPPMPQRSTTVCRVVYDQMVCTNRGY